MSDSQQVQLCDIYKFLAQAIRYPEADWFTEEFLTLYVSLLQELDWPDSDTFLNMFTEQYLENLQVEYTRLFITGVPNVIAPPYASIYLDDVVNGPTTSQTKQFYMDHGYTLDSNDFPDHIVAELDFAALLEQTEPGSSDHFLNALFLPWFGMFKQRVLENTSENYYRTTLQLIDFFTQPDIDS